MNQIDVTANAKINLTLDVLGKRDDGYHELKMIMQTVSLSDKINLKKTSGGITLKSNLKYLPTDSRNIAFAAAELFVKKAGISDGISINMKKNMYINIKVESKKKRLKNLLFSVFYYIFKNLSSNN